MKLPKSFICAVLQYDIAEGDIVFAAAADFDMDYRFADSIVALTGDKLILAAYPYRENAEYHLGGYPSRQMSAGAADPGILTEAPTLWVYNLERVDAVKVIRQIGTGILIAVIDGTERKLCHFSNTRMAAFLRLSALFNKTKKNEEILPKDLNVENGRECCPKCGMIYYDQARKICPKCMDKKSILLRILEYYKPYKCILAVMILCYIGTAGLNLVWPYLSGTVLYDRILVRDEAFLAAWNLPQGRFMAALVMLVFAMIFAKITMQAVGILQGVLSARITPQVLAAIKSQVFASMGKLSISFYSRRQTGGLMSRITDDAEEVSGFFVDAMPNFFINAGTLLSTWAILFVIHPGLAVVTVFLMPVLVYINVKLEPTVWYFVGKMSRARRRMNGQINENITGARVVRAFGQEDLEIEHFSKNNKLLREADKDRIFSIDLTNGMYRVVESMIVFLVWAVGSALIISGSNLELGVLLTFSAYVGQIRGPLHFMGNFSHRYTWCMNAAQRLFEIIDAVPEVLEAPDPIRPQAFTGEIELRNVTFGYEANKPVLKNVSFHVQAGEVLGIVGRSGAGKSTLVNLISRLYDAEQGEVLVDGINVKEYGFQELRKNIAMVSQETYIFMGTVAENIAYARPEATLKEIIHAAIQAGAHDFICRMPEGYNTILGGSGRSLSGGEKQRISIARAILADPKILILDEATSAVDTATELTIQRALERLGKGRTVLSIAHRLSTLRNANHLIVLEGGQITEYGTHEELLEKKGTYYKLRELQTKALAMRGIE